MEDCTLKSLNTNFTAKHEVISEVHMACYSLEDINVSVQYYHGHPYVGLCF